MSKVDEISEVVSHVHSNNEKCTEQFCSKKDKLKAKLAEFKKMQTLGPSGFWIKK